MAWRAALLIYSLAGNRRDRKAGRGHGQYKAEGNSGPHAFAPGWDDFIEKIHAPSGASERIHAASGRAHAVRRRYPYHPPLRFLVHSGTTPMICETPIRRTSWR